jgi:hypothetical protein
MHGHMNVKLFFGNIVFFKNSGKIILHETKFESHKHCRLGHELVGLSNVNIQCPLWGTT